MSRIMFSDKYGFTESILTEPDVDVLIEHSALFSLHNFLTGSCLLGRKEFAKSHAIDPEHGSMTMKIIYRIFVLFIGFFLLPFSFMCCILLFIHVTVVGPVVYIFTGKMLKMDYIYKLLDGYCEYVDELQKKGDYD